jgi:DNA invertase Pin-like site-specific DNA recombinase
MTTLLKQVRQVPSGIILPLDEVRHRAVIDAIDKCGGNYLLAAKMLGIGRTTIYRWVRIYGHDPPKDQAAALQAATPGGDGNGSKAPACDPLQPENQSVRPTPLGRRRSA